MSDTSAAERPASLALLLDEDAAAARIGVNVYELRSWRRGKGKIKGPPFTLLGVRAFYRAATIERFVATLPEYANAAEAFADDPDRAEKSAAQAVRAASARGHRKPKPNQAAGEARPEDEARP